MALGLTAGRVYELVSPLYKGGYGANTIYGVSPSGESVAFGSQGAFAGAPWSGLNVYLANRGSLGWSTVSLAAPASVLPLAEGHEPADFSPTLELSLIKGVPGPNQGEATNSQTEDEFLLHDVDTPDVAANFSLAGMVLKAVGDVKFKASYSDASPNFSQILFHTSGSEPLLARAVGANLEVYDLLASSETASGLTLVGVNDSGELIDAACPVALGSAFGHSTVLNAVAANGSEIFFTTDANKIDGADCDGSTSTVPGNPGIVYVRIDGQRTVPVSVALPSACIVSASCASAPQQRAEFQGASESGSCVFFTTPQPLVTGDTDVGNDLYLARIGHAGEAGAGCSPVASSGQGQLGVTSLVQVSHDQHAGEAAEVQGVVAMSQDGSRVYFVAHGVLSEGPDAEGRVAVKGADNLYVYNSASGGQPVFVADLCSGSEMSGEVLDPECPSGQNQLSDSELWLTSGEAQLAADGEFLLFSTYARLLPGDANSVRDVYRYDAATGSLVRVSIGENGFKANGNEAAADASIKGEGEGLGPLSTQARLSTRAISEDGTRVVFTTEAALSSDAINGLVNAYEWQEVPGSSEGAVSLISTGNSNERVNDVTISPDGRDVFFVTSQGLIREDIDGAPDVYDARLGGGFPEPSAPVQQCSGDACQGALSVPAPLLVPGSVSQAPGENFSPPGKAPVKAKTKTKKPKKKEKKAKGKSKGKTSRSARKGGGGGR